MGTEVSRVKKRSGNKVNIATVAKRVQERERERVRQRENKYKKQNQIKQVQSQKNPRNFICMTLMPSFPPWCLVHCMF